MANNLGPGVSRVLDPSATSFTEVVFQEGKTPLDSEWNLLQELATDFTRKIVSRSVPSGWMGNETNLAADFVTSSAWSNWFKFGTQRAGEQNSVMWAAVNGWLIPVTGTRTGTPPGSPNDVDRWNVIALDPPPSNAGDFRMDFAFLEVWLARTPPSPSSLNKPAASAIWRYGNVEGGCSFLPDHSIDPALGFESSQRVQLQYRIRVVKGLIGLTSAPDGFDATVVKAQGAAAIPTSFVFTNMRQVLGDPGLWRAGDGTQNALGTVDGYVYAVPICAVSRRNSMPWAGDPAPNLNGGINRNPTAIDRTGIKTFTGIPSLAGNVSASATAIQLAPYLSIPLPTNPATPMLIQVGDELMTYTAVVPGTPSAITGLTRGVNGTRAEAHPAGTPILLVSGRPDGLFADQIAKSDILDLRHVVNPNGFDYSSLLKSNLDKLLKGQLRANWKRSGAGPQGTFISYQDKFSADPPALGVTKLDAPDGYRTIFSDAATVQQKICIVAPSGQIVAGPPYPIISADWDLKITAYALNQGQGDQFNPGDVIRVPINQLRTGLSGADADQINWLIGSAGEVSIRVDGQSNPLAPSLFSTAVDANGDLVITLAAGFPAGVEARLYLTLSVMYGPGRGLSRRPDSLHSVSLVSPSTRLLTRSSYTHSDRFQLKVGWLPLWSKHRKTTYKGAVPVTAEAYADLGSKSLVLTPFQQITWPANMKTLDGTSVNLSPVVRSSGLYGSSTQGSTSFLRLDVNGNPVAWAPEDVSNGDILVVTGGGTSVGNYRVISSVNNTLTVTPALPATETGLEWEIHRAQGLMPLYASDATTPKWATTDPLELFSGTSQNDLNAAVRKNLYVTLPRQMVPGWGEVRVPILTTGNTTFSEGINFLCLSRNGETTNQNYLPYPGSGAVFSTLNLLTADQAAAYNTKIQYGTTWYAGARLFTDARGLGRQGIELPPFYGIARLYAVYEAGDYKLHGSASQNLLRQNTEGATFWIEQDQDGDSTFILNAEALDLSKSPNFISSFAAGHYVLEASIFGFDRGSFGAGEFRLVLARNRTQAVDGVRTNNIGADITSPVTVLPGPMTGTALIDYSRTPYQGDAWGSQTSSVDIAYQAGPLLTGTAHGLASTGLDAAHLTRPNQKAVEILAAVGFSTTLGTGRISGDVSMSTLHQFDVQAVGYEDPTAYPPATSLDARPAIAAGNFISADAIEVGTDYLGCTERLPLGSLFRDKDFRGQSFGSGGPVAALSYHDSVGVGAATSIAVGNQLEQTEVNLSTSSVGTGAPGDVLVHVDGEQGNYALLTNFRTNRGGSVYVANGSHPGGELSCSLPSVKAEAGHTNVLCGTAFLVRNYPLTVGASEVSAGSELMMLVTTTVQQLKDTTSRPGHVLLGANGAGEGYSAADLYRIEGHPLTNDHVRQVIDTTIPLARKG